MVQSELHKVIEESYQRGGTSILAGSAAAAHSQGRSCFGDRSMAPGGPDANVPALDCPAPDGAATVWEQE